ncbi:gliding motility-associated C-terminal domain-containing protein [Maribacter sedimenticola]|uniref:Gliding motility-associated C-terminal domain-containing protein n=1 Tax=Maribacter sedimenticola TaxID=228956 RepID=A0ABY1SDA5_9FLAO|nr:gliding motility-associated C-terminal domain-containing protein [Maribacter sedimenticola]SNR26747.1 gliding motility-associated C-terminal domain-containing protein [Maribacter sedimenticola]
MQKNTHFYLMIWAVMTTFVIQAQQIHNTGNIQIHANSQVGIFNSIVNEGSFQSNEGLVGFYGTSGFNVAGSNELNLYDIEIANEERIVLNTPIAVKSNANFIVGDIETSKVIDQNYLQFGESAFYNGSSNFSKVNGFVKTHVETSFIFPVGDDVLLRPMSVVTTGSPSTYTGCYIFDNATLYNPFNTDNEVIAINTNEFWLLKGDNNTSVTLQWNDRSALETIAEKSADICIVGFEITTSTWRNLGSINSVGDLDNGFVTSQTFIPNEYAALTFGVIKTEGQPQNELSMKGYHYLVSPNGDGINDTFIIDELAEYENNELQIYDRNGLLVYKAQNYTDEFDGFTGTNISAISRNKGLPQGIYFYIANVNGGEFSIQGFLYIDR